MTDLTGKTALVTGSVQGIGLAIATAFATEGARVVLHGLCTPDEADAAVAKIRTAGAADAQFFAADMRVPQQIDVMMAKVEKWGGADILVNNAGIQMPMSLAKVEADTWNMILAVNLSGAFHTMRHALPKMAKKGFGRVINIASVHGLVASADKAPYVASKFGLVGLSRVAALEYAAQGSKASGGVTVNCICPGWTETELLNPQISARAAEFRGDRKAGIADLLAEKQPSKRMSDPSEIAALALWLCSPVAHNITGTSIPVDGGWTTQ